MLGYRNFSVLIVRLSKKERKYLLDEIDEAFQHNHKIRAIHPESGSTHHRKSKMILHLSTLSLVGCSGSQSLTPGSPHRNAIKPAMKEPMKTIPIASPAVKPFARLLEPNDHAEEFTAAATLSIV